MIGFDARYVANLIVRRVAQPRMPTRPVQRELVQVQVAARARLSVAGVDASLGYGFLYDPFPAVIVKAVAAEPLPLFADVTFEQALGTLMTMNKHFFKIWDENTILIADGLLVVCDGMGGHQAGDVASRTAVDAVRRLAHGLGQTPYPFERAGDKATLAAHVVPTMPAHEDVRGAYEAAREALDRFLGLHARLLGQLALAVEASERAAGASGGETILAPMPGLVVAIRVRRGERVQPGQSVLVVEAMKMQNVLRAEQDATVKLLHAKPGESLAVDQAIIEFA